MMTTKKRNFSTAIRVFAFSAMLIAGPSLYGQWSTSLNFLEPGFDPAGSGSTQVLIDADNGETTFTYDVDVLTPVAPACSDGTFVDYTEAQDGIDDIRVTITTVQGIAGPGWSRDHLEWDASGAFRHAITVNSNNSGSVENDFSYSIIEMTFLNGLVVDSDNLCFSSTSTNGSSEMYEYGLFYTNGALNPAGISTYTNDIYGGCNAASQTSLGNFLLGNTGIVSEGNLAPGVYTDDGLNTTVLCPPAPEASGTNPDAGNGPSNGVSNVTGTLMGLPAGTPITSFTAVLGLHDVAYDTDGNGFTSSNTLPAARFTQLCIGNSAACTCEVTLDAVASTNETCTAADDGTITITASGSNLTGTGLQYSIDGGTSFQATGTFTGLADGTYNIVVEDNGDGDCEATTMVTIAAGTLIDPPTAASVSIACEDPAPTLSASCDDTSCSPCAFDPNSMIISIEFTGDHSYVSDLGFYIQGPSGCMSPLLTLATNPGNAGEDNFCNNDNDFNNLIFTNVLSGDFNACTLDQGGDVSSILTGSFSSAYGTPINWAALSGCDITEGGWQVILGDCVSADVGDLDQVIMTVADNGTGGSCLGLGGMVVYDSGPSDLDAALNDNECIPGVDNPAVFAINVPSQINWYNVATGGTPIATGAMLPTVGTTAEQGAFDNATAGDYTYYAECVCAGCASQRTPVVVTVEDCCEITAVNPINIVCVDPGTPSDPSDDRIEFDLIVEGSSATGGFQFTSSDPNVSGGCTLTYGATHTSFVGSPGSAGGGPITLNIVDCGSATCIATGIVADPGSCSPCPDFTLIAAGDLELTVTESVCTEFDGTNENGVLAVPSVGCPTGSTIEYSISGVGLWGTMLPAYDQTTSISIDTRCVCDGVSTFTSEVQTTTTVPGACPTCPDLSNVTAPQAYIKAQSICTDIGGGQFDLAGGEISTPIADCDGNEGVPEAACPPGSHIEYSTDNGWTWRTDVPDYDNSAVMTILTRCVCDADPSIESAYCSVMTSPGSCLDPVDNVCDCSADPTPFTINTIFDNGNQDGYTLIYSLIDVTNAGGFSLPDGGQPLYGNAATFAGLADNLEYEVCSYNVLETDLPAFTAALMDFANHNDASDMTGAFETLCYSVNCTIYNEDCGCCPDLTDSSVVPDANIVSESMCTDIGGANSDVEGGVIADPTTSCPDGSALEYSLDGGTTWGSSLPVYQQTTAMSITTRCICGIDATVIAVGNTLTTSPGTCMDCPDDLDTFTPPEAVINFESACTDGNVLGGGLISQPNNACPAGSTIEYLVTNSVGVIQSDWSTTLPTYDQNTAITIQTRCACDANGTNSLASPGITTIPGVCPEEPANVCDCSMAPNSLTINKIAVNGGQPNYSIVYSLLEVGTTNHTFSNPMGGVATFPNLEDGVDYQFCAYNVLDDEIDAFIIALSDAAAHIDAADGTFINQVTGEEFCYTVSCEIINEDCGCCIANAGEQSTDSCTSFCEGDDAAMVTVDIEFALDQASLNSQGPIPGTEYALYVTDENGKIISLVGQATISTPVQNLSFTVDVSGFAAGDYCIHGANIDLNDPDLNATTLADFVDLNITSLGNLLTESDGSLTINDGTVCGDVNVDNCTPFTITEPITFDAVAICRDFTDISSETDLTGTSYYIEVTNITGGSGTYIADVGGQTAPLVGNTYGPFTHTGLGTGIIAITVTDDNSTNPTGCVDCVATAEVIETICAETVCDCNSSPNGGSILAQSTGYNAVDHCMVYTITKPDGTIEVNETGFYDDLPDGDYTVCAFNVLTDDKPLFMAALTDAAAVELAAALDASFGAFCYDGLCYEETVECFPVPTLADVKLECTALGGNVSLSTLFTTNTTPGGTFTLAADSPAGATINGGSTLNYSAPGCYHIIYTVGDCPLMDDAFLCVPQEPEPSFSIQDQVCFSTGDDPTTHVYTPKLNVTPVGTVTWAIDASSTAMGSVDANGAVTVTSTGILMICMTEEISYAACGTNPAGSCEASFCQQITITDGTAQDASFDISAQDQCPGTEITLTPEVNGGEFSGDGVTDNGLGTGAIVTIPADCSSVDVTYTLNDPNGCTSSATQTVFGDRNDPVITVTDLEDLVLECNDPNNNNAMLIADWLASNGGATATDACDVTWEFDLIAESDFCSTAGSGTYRFTVTDQCGNSTSTTASIITNDSEIPVITAPESISLDCSVISETASPAAILDSLLTAIEVTDDCDINPLVSVSINGATAMVTPPADPPCPAGTIESDEQIVFDLTGQNTIDAEGSANNTIITICNPSLANQMIDEVSWDVTATTIGASWLNEMTIGVSDATNPGVNVLTINPSPTNTSGTETNTSGGFISLAGVGVLPLVADAGGCLTIELFESFDDVAGAADAMFDSGNITFQKTTCILDPTASSAATAIDVCATSPYDIIVTWNATDACGNEADEQSTTITINPDTEPPVIIAPDAISLDCSVISETASPAAMLDSLLAEVRVTDNCDTDPTLISDFDRADIDVCADVPYDITITWTASDACGNEADVETTVISIIPDTEAPAIIAPDVISLDCSVISETASPAAMIDSLLAEVRVTDNCDTDPVLTSDFDRADIDVCADAPYDITITWNATDACGNEAPVQTTIISIVPDTEAPVITAPDAITLDCDLVSETTSPAAILDSLFAEIMVSDNCDTDPVITMSIGGETVTMITPPADPPCPAGTIESDEQIVFDLTGQNTTDLEGSLNNTTITICNPSLANQMIDEVSWDLTQTAGLDPTALSWLSEMSIGVSDANNPGVNAVIITPSTTDASGNEMNDSGGFLSLAAAGIPALVADAGGCLTIELFESFEDATGDPEGIFDSGNITFQKTTCIADAITGEPVLIDMCADEPYDIIVTWNAMDACGNEAITQTSTVTVIPDTEAPVIEAPENISIDCSMISETASPAAMIDSLLAEVRVTDNCDTDPVLISDFDRADIDVCADAAYDITITWDATDACGNEAVTQTTVISIVPDTEIPVITAPASISLDCSAISETADPAAMIDSLLAEVRVTDNCDTDPVLISDFDRADIDVCTDAAYDITITWDATDACGNEAVTQTTVISIVPDTEIPVITAPASISLDCSVISETADPAAMIDSLLAEVRVTDNCDTDPVLISDFDRADIDVCADAAYDITITWDATDACGNEAVTQTTVISIVPDTEIPVITAPASISLDCSVISETADPAAMIDSLLAEVRVTDNCDTDPVLISDFDRADIDVCADAAYDITITWDATDACGNEAVTQTTVISIVPDTEVPVITAPASISLDCSAISETADPAAMIDSLLAEVRVTDNCDTDPVLISDFDRADIDVCADAAYDITITWDATDACGNEAVTQTTVISIVPDTEIPVITAPASISLDCSVISETADPAAMIDSLLAEVRVTDNCDTDPVLISDFDRADIDVCADAAYDITITWNATDACGNEAVTQTTVISIVPDTEVPEFTFTPEPLSFDCMDINETEQVTVSGWLDSVRATDNCDTDIVITHDYTNTSLDICNGGGTTLVTWTATDACGRFATTTSTITVTEDNAPPVIVAPAPIVIDCTNLSETTDPSALIADWLSDASVTDICDTDPVMTHDFDNTVLDVCATASYTITVTWMATDACNNAAIPQTSTITVNPDTEAPVITAPETISIDCSILSGTVDPSAMIDSLLAEVRVTDNCDTDPVLTSDFDINTIDICADANYDITITWTATDACGNNSSMSSIITIVPDVTPPTLSCVGLTTSGDTPFYDCEGDISWDHPLVTDDCNVAIYTYTITDPDGTVNGPFDLTGILQFGATPTSFDFEEGVSVVLYYAEDACGNASECVFEVTVGDPVAPFFLDCPDDLFVGNDPDECSAKVNWEVPVAWDNCDIPANPDQIELDTSLIVTQLIGAHNGNVYEDIQSGQVIPVGTYLIGYVVVDTDGNTDTCQFNLTVWDTQDPILMAGIPEDVTLSCEIPLDTFVMMPHHVMDNCVEDPTIENTLVSTRVMDPEVCEYYSYQDTFFYTVTDSVQILPDGSPKVNQMIWKWVVTWIDTTAPQIIPPPDTLIETCTYDIEIVESIVQVDSIQVDSLVAIGDDWVVVTVQLKKDSMVFDTIFTPIPIGDRMNGLPIVDDNCAPDSLFVLEKPFLTFRDSIEFLCKGDKTAIVHRWWIAEDPCGNIDSAEQLITILADPNPPVLDVYAKDTISLGPDGHVVLTRDDLVKSVFNACFADETLITVDISPNYFNCSDIGVHNVLVSATDPCSSQTAYEYVEVTIVDNIAPVLNCPISSTPIPLTINPRNCDGAFNDILEILGGNDCDVTITTDPPLDASIDMSTTQISVTATDASGNSTSCIVNVQISLTESIDFDEVLSCNDRVNISLNSECWLELTPDQILEGSPDVCTELLCIEVEDNTGADHLNFFDVTDVGQVFRVRVVDCSGSGNSCWGEVLLEEKQIPDIVWPQDTSVLCVEPTDTSYFKIHIPEILNCEPVISIEYEDSYVEYDQCSTPRATITRKWIVTDDEGNVAIDTQLIDILPFSNNHVRFPKDITIEDPIDCKLVTESIDDIENNILDPTSKLHPDSTGLPNIFGLPLQTNAGLCLFSLGYEDRVLEICSGSYQIFRKWEVNDVCSPYVEGVNPVSHTQVITIYDTDGPILEEAEVPVNDTLSYNPWECAYSGPLKVPGGDIESCGDIFFEAYVTGGGYIVTDGTISGGDLQIAAVGMGPGDHWITYVYTDGCNNISLYKYVVTVIDEVAPVAVCQGDISVTVTTDGVAKIYANDIDGGSHDAGCGPVSTCIVRMVDFEEGYLGKVGGYDAYIAANGCHIDGEYRDTIFDKLGDIESVTTLPYVLCKDELKVCCTDLGDQTIVLQATDPGGLTSICMAPIRIIDKSNASLVCAPHAIDCTDDKDVDLLPPTGASSICGDELPLQYFDEDSFIDGCGEGQIFRVWYLDANNNGSLDDGEIYCNQVITVSNGASFDPYSLKWPKHYTGELLSGKNLECNEDDEVIESTDNIAMGAVFSCSATDPGDAPVWCNTSCGLVGLSSDIDTVTAGDACLKLIKRWTVIDWCYWEANGASPGDDANDTDNDSFEAVEDWAQGVCTGCAENLADPVYLRYTDVDVDGYYTYDQVIKVVDDTDPFVSTANVVVNTTGGAAAKGDDTPCTGTGIVSASASDLCGSDAISGELISWVITYNNGAEITISNAEGSEVSIETEAGQPGDEHTVTFEVSDGCGNRSAALSTVTFGDEKKPVPLCISGVTTAFMQTTGTVDVWAKDFDLGSFDNCTEVDFTVVFSGESPDSSEANITFDCDDLTQFYDLDIWVWDENGNGDFCTVGVLIGGSCEGNEGAASATIAGQISTESGDMIERAEVSIDSPEFSEYPLSVSTTSSGEYAFPTNPTGFDYDISVLKDGDYLNGVTTADLIAIQEHIAGETILDSPYKVIAADINNDQQISVLDVIVLRNVILGISRRFANNTSWRFVDESQTFVNIQSPWPFTEILNIRSLDSDQMSEDFIGVKIGDVTNDVTANSMTSASSRTDEFLDLVISDSSVEASSTVVIPISSDQFKDVVGFQFTLEHEKLVFEGIEGGVIDISTEHVGVHEDALTVSWENLDPISSDETLFSLRFMASESVDLSDVLTINSSITKAEIYRDTYNDMANLSLHISDKDLGQVQLHQNDPNPFVNQTTIGFTLPTASEATLLLFTIDGKEVKRIEGSFVKGLNELIITESDIDFAGGLLYYQLQVGEFTDTKKMMVVK